MQDCNYMKDPGVDGNARLTGYVADVVVPRLLGSLVLGAVLAIAMLPVPTPFVPTTGGN